MGHVSIWAGTIRENLLKYQPTSETLRFTSPILLCFSLTPSPTSISHLSPALTSSGCSLISLVRYGSYLPRSKLLGEKQTQGECRRTAPLCTSITHKSRPDSASFTLGSEFGAPMHRECTSQWSVPDVRLLNHWYRYKS